MTARRAPRPVRFLARALTASLAVAVVFLAVPLLLAAGLWWVPLVSAGILIVFVVRGRMWAP